MENKTTKPFYNTTIPNDWTVKKLSQIANVKTGPFGAQLHESDYVRVGTPIITVEHLSENGIVHSNLPLVSSEDKKRLNQYVLLENDIVFSRVGSVDRNSLITDLENGWLFSGRLLRVRINHGNNSLFVSQYFNSDSFKQLIRSIAVGQTMPSLNTEILSGVQIPLPPLPEQRAIAHVLSLMDTAINTNNQLIAQKELRKKWLMQNLLTGKKRLMGFGGEWKEYKLKHFIVDHNEKPKPGNGYEVLTSAKSGLMKQTDYYGDNRITNREDADYNVIPPNYLTYRSRSDDGLFTFNKNILGITGLISGYYPVFTIKNGDIDFILMFCNYYRQKLTKYSIGTSQLVLSMNALKTANFILPEFEEQTAIARVLQAADKEIQLLKTKTDKLREQKKGMMQVLLTGKKRLHYEI